MARDNFELVRDKIRFQLEHYDAEAEALVVEDPSPKQVMALLDALHADINNSESSEARELRGERWYQ